MTLGKRIKRDIRDQMKLIKKNKSKYLFIAPYVILFFIFTVFPVLISVFLGFTNFNILEKPDFIGLQNYFRLFIADDLYIKALGNTLLFAMITGPGGYIISLVMAWFINELPKTIRVILTVLLYAPSLTGGMTPIFKIFFSSDAQGYLNAFLLEWGFITGPIKWLENANYVVPIIIFVVLWGSLGTSFLSFIAGLQGISKEYYEAAAMDGIKNRWQELWYVTLPLMKPQLVFGAVISITGAFNIGSIITGLAGNPSVDYSAHTVMQHLQDYGTTRFEMGYASAIATVLFFIMIFLNKFIQKFIKKVGE
ncbi:MAG: sugar ABC transporter permease [Clostridiales bacterium]|nr:sugar ABC transporter permease [Clostridiales bacterium]